MKHNYITFDHAVLLKKCGFDQYTDYCIQKFTSDYIYDEEPTHPESHKKGEVRVYRMTYDPNEKNRSLYPMMTVDEAYEWLRKQDNPSLLSVYPAENHSDDWNCVIYKKNKEGHWYTHESMYLPNTNYDEATETLLTIGLKIYYNEFRRDHKVH